MCLQGLKWFFKGVSLAARLKILNCSKSSTARLDFRMNILHWENIWQWNLTTVQICRSGSDNVWKTYFDVHSSVHFGNVREKKLKIYQFPHQLLSQVLRNDIKSDRNWSIWSQLLCALTGVKHNNIHKTYKIHGFSQKFL